MLVTKFQQPLGNATMIRVATEIGEAYIFSKGQARWLLLQNYSMYVSREPKSHQILGLMQPHE